MLLYGGRKHKQFRGNLRSGRISPVIDRSLAGKGDNKNIGAYMEPGPRFDWLPEGTTGRAPAKSERTVYGKFLNYII